MLKEIELYFGEFELISDYAWKEAFEIDTESVPTRYDSRELISDILISVTPSLIPYQDKDKCEIVLRDLFWGFLLCFASRHADRLDKTNPEFGAGNRIGVLNKEIRMKIDFLQTCSHWDAEKEVGWIPEFLNK